MGKENLGRTYFGLSELIYRARKGDRTFFVYNGSWDGRLDKRDS